MCPDLCICVSPTLYHTLLLWTQQGPHLLSSNIDTESALSYVHSLAITTVLCCPFITFSAPNMITALHLILHLLYSFFLFFFFLTQFLALFSLCCSVTQCRSPPVYLLMLIASVMYWKCPWWLFRANCLVLCCYRAYTITVEAGWGLHSLGENNDWGC